MTLLQKAVELAEQAHKGQKYGDSDYFDAHVMPVAAEYKTLFGDDIDGICTALLHDVIEDGDVSYKQIEVEFGFSVAQSISYLTKIKSDNYADYMLKLTEDVMACKVKYCDSMVNLEKCISTCQFERAKKYLENLNYLYHFVKEYFV